MEIDIVEKTARSGCEKLDLLRHDAPRYWLRSIMAGMYLSMVVLVYWSLIQNLHESPFGKVIASAFFGTGLSVIVFTKTELFTSNNMYLAMSSISRRTTWKQSAWLWTVCWLGNLIGALAVAFLLMGGGVLAEIPADHALNVGALHKAHQTGIAILIKGILANWIVCLAVWVALKLKEDLAKIVAMILIVFIFLYLGFEHSIANMGTFSMSLLGNGTLTLGEAIHNLVFSTLGNIVGGAGLVGVAGFLADGKKASTNESSTTRAVGFPVQQTSK